MRLTEEDHLRIADAVASAESLTSGEIRCVLARESGDVRYGALVWAALAALLAPALALLLGFKPPPLSQVFGAWSIGHFAGRGDQVLSVLASYVALQGVVFLAAWLLAAWPGLRRTLTPAAVLERRVRAAALEQFGALGLHRTRDRTAVLLYASLAEHRAEVVADEGIYAKAPKEVWNEVVALLAQGLARGDPADGFISAVTRTGEILKASLPPRSDDADELPNDLVQPR